MSSLSKFRYANNRLSNLNFKIYIIYLKTIMLIFLIYSNTNTIYLLKSMLNRSRNTKIQKQNKKKRKNKK